MLIERITASQQGQVFLDGSKDPERLRQLLGSKAWNIKVVRLLRDGRGIVNSYMAHQKVDMRSATTEWLRTERACGRVISKIPPKDIFTVKYEEVCHEPRKATGKIFEFAGLDGDDLPLGIVAPQLHILGNAMRLNPDKSITLDEKWKRQLLPKELEAFDAIAGDYNRSRGYR